jgi:hypothetical protein
MNSAEPTLGEFLVAIFLAAAAAVPSAIAAFVFAIFLCDKLLAGEATEWGLVAAPLAALASGAIVFAVVFRKIARYGSQSTSDH